MGLFEKRTILFFLRVSLAAVFIASSGHKIMDPAAFARILYGYGMFPAVSINILAIIVPFVELFAGIALIAGPYQRSALLLINLMLLFFIVIIGINLLRGYEFDCGCFSFGEPGHASSAGKLVVRDAVMLVCGLFIHVQYSGRKRRESTTAR